MDEDNHPSESERRLATVMFADISGFTAMSEMMDHEQVTRIMNECFSKMEECVKTYGGKIDKFIGDCVMVIFGVPKAFEDAPQKAVNTAIEFRNCMATLNAEKGLKISLRLHIGINTGPLLAGMVGGSQKHEYTVIGDTVNLASHLKDESLPGQILVGSATYHATKEVFEYKSHPPIKVKGKEKPIPIYEVLSVKEETHRRHTALEQPTLPAMIGREDQLMALELHIMKAINGKGSVISVIGEPGIGKTRLIAETKRSDAIKRVTLLEGCSISIGRSLSFHLIVDLMKNWAGIKEDDSGPSSLEKLEKAIRTIYPEGLVEVLPFVATVMGLRLSGRYADRVRGIEGEALEKLIFKNLRDMLIRASEQKPVVAILEDLHWADTSSMEKIESLFRLAEHHRIVFINLFRPEHCEMLERVRKAAREILKGTYFEICLEPLDERFAGELITNLLKTVVIPHGLKEKIIERSGGNPFFIEEVVNSLIQQGAVARKRGSFIVTDKINEADIPLTINEVIMARIDRLTRENRELVRMASVIGRNFYYRIVCRVAQEIDRIDSRLKYLENIQLIRDAGRTEELEYLFRHALTQEAAYESILVQRRKEIHLQVANAIEKVFEEKLHDFYGMLAYHFSKGEDPAKAEKYLIKAGEEALRASASAEALYYYREALRIYLSTYGEDADAAKVAMMEKNIALALFNRGQYADAIEYFDRVLAFHGVHIPRNPAALALKAFSGFVTCFASIYFPQFKWKKTPSQEEKEIISLFHRKVQAYSSLEPKSMFLEGLCLLRLLVNYDPDQIENGLGLMSTLFSWTGRSLGLSRRVLEFTKDRVNKDDVKAVLFYEVARLIHNCFCGEWPKEVVFNGDLIERNLEVGQFITPLTYIMWCGILEGEIGNSQATLAFVQKMADVNEKYDNDFARVLQYCLQGWLFYKYRRIHESLTHADSCIQFFEKIDFRMYLIAPYAFKAQAQYLSGDVQGSFESLSRAEDIRSGMVTAPVPDGFFLMSRFAINLVQFEKEVKDKDRHAKGIDPAALIQQGREAVSIAARAAMFRVEASRLMGSFYWIMGKQGKALAWWKDSIKYAIRLNARVEMARTYFEVGRRLSEPASKYRAVNGIKAGEFLDKAHVMYRDMDLEWDLNELEKVKLDLGS